MATKEALYRRVLIETWSDTAYEVLTPDAKYLFLYLITTPRGNQCGAFPLTPHAIANHTGLSVAAVNDALGALSPDFIRWWPEHNTVWVCNFFKYQNQSTNFALAARRKLALQPAVVQATVIARYPELAPEETAAEDGVDYPKPTPSPPQVHPKTTRNLPQAKGLPTPRLPEDLPKTTVRLGDTGSRKQETESSQQEPARVCGASEMELRREHDRFASLYPLARRGNEGESWHEWKRMAGEGLLDPIGAMVAGLEGHVASTQWQRDSGRFVPNLPKFLRAQGWRAKPMNDGDSNPNAPRHGKYVS